MKPISLLDIIQDYQNTANKAVQIFQKKYGIKDILEGWFNNLYDQTGKLVNEGIKFYAFHGIGLAAHFKDKVVDFDFAYFPEQRHDGFDLSRLISFAKNQPQKYSEYLTNHKIEIEFKDLIRNNIIANPELQNSTTLYFFKDTLH